MAISSRVSKQSTANPGQITSTVDIQEVAKALDRAAAKINSAAKLLTKIQQ